jgi:hypothetical protein
MGARIPAVGRVIRHRLPRRTAFIDHPGRYAAPMRPSRWLMLGAASAATGLAVARLRREKGLL